MKIKKSTLISAAAVVLVFAGAFGMSYLAGGLRLTDTDAKKAVQIYLLKNTQPYILF